MSLKSSEDAMLSQLDLTQDGLKLVALTFGINLYTGVSFYDCPEPVLKALDLFLERCPREQIRFFATETMRAHKPVTSNALKMPQTWLKPGAPTKEYVALELKSGEAYQDAPQFKYHIWSVAKSKQAKVLSLAFPAVWGVEKTDELLALVRQLCDLFPFASGLAGYSFERSHYLEEDSETHAWNMSMRHVGIDIVRLPFDAKAPGSDAVKGVGWLTMLGSALLAELGGEQRVASQLSRDGELISSKHGVIIKAGPIPRIGDVNRNDVLPSYRNVYQIVSPLIERAAKRSMDFQLARDSESKTLAWYLRLGS
jgi:hypothetical protein